MTKPVAALTPATLGSAGAAPMVVRSDVPQLAEYGSYKRYLRYDFYYSCAYCTITEAEATAIRFAIDHYEPQSSRPDLVNQYSNLMYACDECNSRKGDLTPPLEARAAGFRFFRPDYDDRSDHFHDGSELSAFRTDAKTPTGNFTIDALDLNRASLKRLRKIRAELTECNAFVAHGIAGLRRFPIDQLPQQVKAKAARAITGAIEVIESTGEQIDELLRTYARSELMGDDEDHGAIEQNKQRQQALRTLKGIFPGVWRGRDSIPKLRA